MKSSENALVFTGAPEQWGFIPEMLAPRLYGDERPATELLHDGYAHGGGWQTFDGFTLHGDADSGYSIAYPGDPAQHEIGACHLSDTEVVVLFPHSWVAVINPETMEFELCRMD